jgi:hypothetical protein
MYSIQRALPASHASPPVSLAPPPAAAVDAMLPVTTIHADTLSAAEFAALKRLVGGSE